MNIGMGSARATLLVLALLAPDAGRASIFSTTFSSETVNAPTRPTGAGASVELSAEAFVGSAGDLLARHEASLRGAIAATVGLGIRASDVVIDAEDLPAQRVRLNFEVRNLGSAHAVGRCRRAHR